MSKVSKEELEMMATDAGITVEDLQHGAELQKKLYDAVRELTLHLYKSSGAPYPTSVKELTMVMIKVLMRESTSPVLYGQAQDSAERYLKKNKGR